MIYQRQKILLALLRETPNRALSKSHIVKCLFLLKKEESLDRFLNFYGFFPHRDGPFSFLVLKDMEVLEGLGLMETDSKLCRYVLPRKDSPKLELPQAVEQAIRRVIDGWSGVPPRYLEEHISAKYPWYVSRSKAVEPLVQMGSSDTDPAIYTMGYEGLSIDGFLDALMNSRILNIIDVRSNPVSRKYGFSKKALLRECSEAGLGYHHFPELGIPSKIRKQVTDVQALWDYYTKEVLDQNSEALNSVANLCQNRPSVLICFEKRPEDCHRHMIARDLSQRTGLQTIHYIDGRWKQSERENKSAHNRQDISRAIAQV